MNIKTRDLTFTAVFLALGILLPQAFHALNMVGQIFSPMHIPVLLCGFVCGRRYGAICGLMTPLLSSWFFAMPIFFPVAVAMAMELAAYGWFSGFFAKSWHPVLSLLAAMLLGRVVLGLSNWLLFSATGMTYTFKVFFVAAFVTCWPAIVIQVVAIPAILYALHKAKVVSLPTFRFVKKELETQENV